MFLGGLLALGFRRFCIKERIVSCIGDFFYASMEIFKRVVARPRQSHRTSTRSLWIIAHHSRALWFMLLLITLKASCEYTSESAIGTVLAFIQVSRGTSTRTLRHDGTMHELLSQNKVTR